MKHFSDEAWLDFVRRLLPESEMSSMRAHLDDGCGECAEVYGVWEAVTQMAARESEYEPDESVVNTVKRAFAAMTWKPAPAPEARFGVLVFDSFVAAGAAAGIRSISPTARHLLYRSGRLAIDVRLDAYGGTSTTITGQVLGAEAEAAFASQDVSVMRGDATLARTSTNEFGEFQLQVDYVPDLRIRLDITGRQPVVLTLPD